MRQRAENDKTHRPRRLPPVSTDDKNRRLMESKSRPIREKAACAFKRLPFLLGGVDRTNRGAYSGCNPWRETGGPHPNRPSPGATVADESPRR